MVMAQAYKNKPRKKVIAGYRVTRNNLNFGHFLPVPESYGWTQESKMLLTNQNIYVIIKIVDQRKDTCDHTQITQALPRLQCQPDGYPFDLSQLRDRSHRQFST